jgi:hypothetical protein
LSVGEYVRVDGSPDIARSTIPDEGITGHPRHQGFSKVKPRTDLNAYCTVAAPIHVYDWKDVAPDGLRETDGSHGANGRASATTITQVLVRDNLNRVETKTSHRHAPLLGCES